MESNVSTQAMRFNNKGIATKSSATGSAAGVSGSAVVPGSAEVSGSAVVGTAEVGWWVPGSFDVGS